MYFEAHFNERKTFESRGYNVVFRDKKKCRALFMALVRHLSE